MRNYFNFLAILSIAVSSYSCVGIKNEYGMGNVLNANTVSIKPAYRDSASTGTYVSGTLALTPGKRGYNKGEALQFGSINIHHAITQKNINAAIGGYLYSGKYQTIDYQGFEGGYKSFNGFGLNGNFNFNIPFKYTDWRIIGLNVNYQQENGIYEQFRRQIDDAGLAINRDANNTTLRSSLYTEFILKEDQFEAGISFAYGLGKNKMIGRKIFVTRKKFTLSLEQVTTADSTDPIFSSSETTHLNIFSIGLAYKIK